MFQLSTQATEHLRTMVNRRQAQTTQLVDPQGRTVGEQAAYELAARILGMPLEGGARGAFTAALSQGQAWSACLRAASVWQPVSGPFAMAWNRQIILEKEVLAAFMGRPPYHLSVGSEPWQTWDFPSAQGVGTFARDTAGLSVELATKCSQYAGYWFSHPQIPGNLQPGGISQVYGPKQPQRPFSAQLFPGGAGAPAPAPPPPPLGRPPYPGEPGYGAPMDYGPPPYGYF